MSGSCAVEPRKVDAISTDLANVEAGDDEQPDDTTAQRPPEDVMNK